MTDAEYERETQRILGRLDEILEQDVWMIDPQARQPVIATDNQLRAYQERLDERRKLHAEMLALGEKYRKENSRSR